MLADQPMGWNTDPTTLPRNGVALDMTSRLLAGLTATFVYEIPYQGGRSLPRSSRECQCFASRLRRTEVTAWPVPATSLCLPLVYSPQAVGWPSNIIRTWSLHRRRILSTFTAEDESPGWLAPP